MLLKYKSIYTLLIFVYFIKIVFIMDALNCIKLIKS